MTVIISLATISKTWSQIRRPHGLSDNQVVFHFLNFKLETRYQLLDKRTAGQTPLFRKIGGHRMRTIHTRNSWYPGDDHIAEARHCPAKSYSPTSRVSTIRQAAPNLEQLLSIIWQAAPNRARKRTRKLKVQLQHKIQVYVVRILAPFLLNIKIHSSPTCSKKNRKFR